MFQKVKIQPGNLVRPIRNSNSSSYIVGKVYEVTYASDDGNTLKAKALDKDWEGNNLFAKDCQVVSVTRKQLEEARDEISESLVDLNKKIRFMDEHDMDEYCPEVIDVMSILAEEPAVEPFAMAKKILSVVNK